MMATKSLAFTFCTFLLGLNFIPLFECSPITSTNGVSMHFIHRDSQKSPFHDPSKTIFQKLNQAFHRSVSRASYLKHATKVGASFSPFQSPLTSGGGEYLMKISIGTPPVEIVAVADTGSDVAWTQCKPCTHCYKQDAPFFDPHKTSTYERLSCKSTQCKSLDKKTCDHHKKCQYKYKYGDGSYIKGDLAKETFTFESKSGETVQIPEVTFGCTHRSGGEYNETASGIVGLGGGPLSIVNQLLNYTGGKFSYCLVPTDSDVTSKINFGTDVKVSGSDVLSTPLFKKDPDTFYYVNLEGISVGNTRLSIQNNTESSDSKDSQGNIIVDSGTTITNIPSKLYHDLESTLIKSISGKRVSDPEKFFTLCYKKDGDLPVFPELVFHFTDADMKMPTSNSFIEVDDGVICLAMQKSDDINILGNVSQMNFLIEFDLENKKVNFIPTDCTKQ